MELNITWDQIHLMITRSTTPDLIILFYRLSEFLDKQFTESKDYIKECELDLFYEMKVKQQCKFIQKSRITIFLKLYYYHLYELNYMLTLLVSYLRKKLFCILIILMKFFDAFMRSFMRSGLKLFIL